MSHLNKQVVFTYTTAHYNRLLVYNSLHLAFLYLSWLWIQWYLLLQHFVQTVQSWQVYDAECPIVRLPSGGTRHTYARRWTQLLSATVLIVHFSMSLQLSALSELYYFWRSQTVTVLYINNSA